MLALKFCRCIYLLYLLFHLVQNFVTFLIAQVFWRTHSCRQCLASIPLLFILDVITLLFRLLAKNLSIFNYINSFLVSILGLQYHFQLIFIRCNFDQQLYFVIKFDSSIKNEFEKAFISLN